MTVMLVSKYLTLQLTTVLKPTHDNKMIRWNYFFSNRRIYPCFNCSL